MSLPKLFVTAVLGAALLPATAQAAAPWSDPVTVPGSSGQAGGAPQVLFTRTRGGAIAFNAPGSFPGTPVLRSILGDDGGPLAATRWDGATNFDTTFGSFAAGDRMLFVGSNGERRVSVAIAPGPQSAWRTELRGPSTGGARSAAAATPHGGAAAVFSTFGPGDIGSVYLVRQTGVKAPLPTQRVSSKGHIRAVSVAINASGDVLVAWDRSGTIEARLWYASSRRFSAVSRLGTVNAAAHLSVALGADRRAIVAWIDQRVSEGNTGQEATVMATARSGSRGFLLPAKRLETYPDTSIPGGAGIKAAYTSDGRGLIAWSGRNAVRVSLVDGRVIRAAQDLAAIPPTDSQNDIGLGGIATSADGAAVVTMLDQVDETRNQVLAAPLAAGAAAFAPAETVSEAATYLHWPSAAFDPVSGRLFVAWQVPPQGSEPNRVELATRPAP